MERMRKTRKKQPHFYGYIGILSLCVAAALLIPQHCAPATTMLAAYLQDNC